MKKGVLSLFTMVLSVSLFSQTVLITEDFEGFGSIIDMNTVDEDSYFGSAGLNQWGINPEYSGGSGTASCSTNPIVVDATPGQPAAVTGFPASTYLHIMSDEAFPFGALGTYCANYMPADGSCYEDTNYFAKMNVDVNTVGMMDVTLNFWWLGECSDYAWGEVYYSTDMGSSWTKVTGGVSEYHGVSDWTEETITDPAWAGQGFLRFGFRFVNNFDPVNVDNLQGFAVDQISISATDDGSCSDTFYGFTVSECNSYTAPSGAVYTTSGTVNDTIPNAAGCDSIMTITMNITEVNDSIYLSMGGDSLYADADDIMNTFSWYDCDSMEVLSGEFDAYLEIPYPGSFAVIVNDGSCVDTSDCIETFGYGIGENSFGSQITLFPNPTIGEFSIDLGKEYSEIEITLSDVLGRVCFKKEYKNTSTISSLNAPTDDGVYFLRITSDSGEYKVIQLLKE